MLHVAAGVGPEKAVRLLLAAKAKPNTVASTMGGFHPLHVAASRGRLDVVTLLLRAKADPCATAANMCTPLHAAAAAEDSCAVQPLLDAGASLSAVTLAEHQVG